MKTSGSTISRSKDKLMEDLRSVVADAEELLKATASQTGERIATARAKAEESLHKAKDRMADAQDEALEQARLAVKTTDDYVQANPWQAVGVAAVVGLVLGVMISRR